jgi:5'-3' exoribonuclease 2
MDDIIARAPPKKVLYLAVDGIAPRAKLAQQRERRFRSAAERTKMGTDAAVLQAALRAKGLAAPGTLNVPFDTNAITPRTAFMVRVAASLRTYVTTRLAAAEGNGPGARDHLWRDLVVILSDDSVPGEGEHKLLKFIRSQRCMPDHDPSTHHCLVGSDADLVLLALATHETNVSIFREVRDTRSEGRGGGGGGGGGRGDREWRQRQRQRETERKMETERWPHLYFGVVSDAVECCIGNGCMNNKTD